MNIIQTMKDRPMLTAGAILVGVLIFYFMTRGGSQSVITQQYDPSATGAGTELAMQQAQLAFGGAQIQAQVSNSAGEREAALQIAQLEYAWRGKNSEAMINLEALKINAGLQLGTLQSTLIAQTENLRMTEETRRSQISSTTQIETTRQLTEALTRQSELNAEVAIAGMQCQGLFDCLF